MNRVMTREELEINEDNLNQYDYVYVKDGSKILGIYVPKKHAEDIKNFVDELSMKEQK